MLISAVQERLSAAFSDLEFDEKRHLYFVKGVNFPSVSKKLEDHYEKFNEEKMLPLSAKKNNTTPEELKVVWHNKRDTACYNGTVTHDYMEKYDGSQRPSTKLKEAGVKFLNDNADRYKIVAREFRMYSRKYGYAGTADKLLYDTIDDCLVLGDYKTNENLFKTYKYLLSPFDYLECHPYNKYQLQLGYYDIMLQEVGIFIKRKLLVHLRPDGSYKTYTLEDFTEDIKEYLNEQPRRSNPKSAVTLW